MMRTVKIASIYPEALNLNGDQANATVLIKQLQWGGVTAELLTLDESVATWPEDIDFLLIGHGSQAAWARIFPKLGARSEWLKRIIASGVVGLAVGSGQEILYRAQNENSLGLGLIYRPLTPVERQSRFVICNLDGVEVLGYLNRATDAPAIERLGSFILTGLHGPVLAKNETLLQSILRDITNKAGLNLNFEAYANHTERASKAVAQVWELESALARE